MLERHEEVPPALLAFIADQVQAQPEDLAEHRRRDPSRRQHLAELLAHTGQRRFDRQTFREMVSWLVSIAQINRDPFALAHALVEELRRRRILLPTAAVLELVLYQARGRARQLVRVDDVELSTEGRAKSRDMRGRFAYVEIARIKLILFTFHRARLITSQMIAMSCLTCFPGRTRSLYALHKLGYDDMRKTRLVRNTYLLMAGQITLLIIMAGGNASPSLA